MPIHKKLSKPGSTSSGSTRGRCRVRFEIDAEPGSRVAVVGNFNAWDPKRHLLKESGGPGHFQRFVYLQPGDYQYKFVIDGDWSADPNCPSFTPNEFGTLNSILKVQRALAKKGRPAQASE